MTIHTRVLRPHQHLPPELRRVLEFEVAHADPHTVTDELLRASLHVERQQYAELLRRALSTPTTSPDEIALMNIIYAHRLDPHPHRLAR